jgi:hypothetical protein
MSTDWRSRRDGAGGAAEDEGNAAPVPPSAAAAPATEFPKAPPSTGGRPRYLALVGDLPLPIALVPLGVEESDLLGVPPQIDGAHFVRGPQDTVSSLLHLFRQGWSELSSDPLALDTGGCSGGSGLGDAWVPNTGVWVDTEALSPPSWG